MAKIIQIFIYGSYAGRVDFWDPMLTTYFLDEVRSLLNDQHWMRAIARWAMQP